MWISVGRGKATYWKRKNSADLYFKYTEYIGVLFRVAKEYPNALCDNQTQCKIGVVW